MPTPCTFLLPRYLHTLDKYIEPLYAGDPAAIMETLPGLLNNIRMMHTIARYYSSTPRMTNLFRKITEQMIAACRKSVEADGNLWEQPSKHVIANLRACLQTNQQYQASCLLLLLCPTYYALECLL